MANSQGQEAYCLNFDQCSVTTILGEATMPNMIVELILPEARKRKGRRRDPETGEVNDNIYSMFDRGFTGHQHLDAFILINMLSEAKSRSEAFAGNGRVFDPVLARFLSPDPFVQSPEYGQNFNRYSYAFNNPLKYTDPNGEFIHFIIGAAIGGAINWLANGAQFNAQGLGYFGVGALAGAMAAGVGMGINSVLAGGSFGAGFMGTAAAQTMTASFSSGFVIGGFAGSTNGVIAGTGNSLLNGDNLIRSLGNGIKQMVIQGFSGAVIGGLAGGVTAEMKGNKFWSGEARGSLIVNSERLNINNPEQRAQ
nr:hypothetical protein [Bacteroidota bacterium]